MRTREYEPVAWSGARPGVSPKPRIFGVAWALRGVANFLEPPLCELLRITLPRRWVNKGRRKGQDMESRPSPVLVSVLVACTSLAFLLFAPQQVVGGPAHRVGHPAYRLRGSAHCVRYPAYRTCD